MLLMNDRTRFCVELAGAIGVGVLMALAAYGGLDYVAGRVLAAKVALAKADLEAQARTPLAACRMPAENEQMHIVVMQRAGELIAECMFVGSRGLYRRTPHGMPEPRP